MKRQPYYEFDAKKKSRPLMQSSRDIQYLYKFRSLSGASRNIVERILLHDELYFPKPSEFNDPFDCSPVPSVVAPKQAIRGYIKNLHKKYAVASSRQERRLQLKKAFKRIETNQASLGKTLQNALATVMGTTGVLSLSANCDHILLWSHYADAHRGVCLRFQASSTTPFFGRAQEINYQVARPVLNPVTNSHQEQVDNALLIKADFWKYEEEWRIIEHEKGPGVHKFPANLLDGIIFGARVTPSDREQVMTWLAQRKTSIEVLDAAFDSKQFRIHIKSNGVFPPNLD